MAQEGKNVIFAVDLVHVVAESEGVYFDWNIIEEGYDIIFQPVKVHRYVLNKAFECICAGPVTGKGLSF